MPTTKYQYNVKIYYKCALMDDTKREVNHDGNLMKGWQGLGCDGPYIGEGQAWGLGAEGPMWWRRAGGCFNLIY